MERGKLSRIGAFTLRLTLNFIDQINFHSKILRYIPNTFTLMIFMVELEVKPKEYAKRFPKMV